ncbi:hypothetical protein PanWU01x14_154680 [Parasponia andersonii]|uniref:Uncharacterized protein n=1 Tax=Parasponia andersonii TaxID=3476 RepID=A0A2P5CGG7_PARAD|nr:hypothetical protein PanWU01x14_154680 [Parasponia andersonii]
MRLIIDCRGERVRVPLVDEEDLQRLTASLVAENDRNGAATRDFQGSSTWLASASMGGGSRHSIIGRWRSSLGSASARRAGGVHALAFGRALAL